MATIKSQPEVVDALNEILSGELAAINQYFLHAKMCENWGYQKLYKKQYAESIDEMKHADQLIERILYLDGVPNVQAIARVRIGETVKEQFECDLKIEQEAIPRLKEAIVLCRSVKDMATATLLEEILESEEEHLDWLEAQLQLIKNLGEENYLPQWIHE